MKTVDTLKYEMLVRVRDFGTAHTASFPARSIGRQLFAEVNAVVAQIDHHTAPEVSGRAAAREGTTSKDMARRALRSQLEAITQTARALAVETPGLDVKFRLPSAQSTQALLSTARAFIQDAEPLASRFTTHAMPRDFLGTLRRAVVRFEQAAQDHDAGKRTRMSARASITTSLRGGLNAVRRLDAVVVNTLREDPATMAVWESIRHVERMPRAAAAEPATAAEAPPAPAPQPTPPSVVTPAPSDAKVA